MKSSALRREMQESAVRGSESKEVAQEHRMKPVRSAHDQNDRGDRLLRMYTEEEVAEILQVSVSKLRKWRMKKNGGTEQGPPFRKIGRLVRYSGQGLLAYVNHAQEDD